MKFLKYGFYCIGIVVMFSCEYYVGINQQPEFTDTDIEEGMNIFGLLRPDFKADYNKSFVFVQKMWPVLELGGYTIISDASVWVEHVEDGDTIEAIEFPMMPSDSLFSDTLYRPVTDFVPLPGEKYRLICRHNELPDAMGEAVFPSKPRIVENSLSVDGRSISFTLATDTLIKMVDIYITGGTYSQWLERIVPEDQSDTEINLLVPFDPAGYQLKIFSYDANLAVYYGNSNTSLNFNKYRTTISTLESGYGVFGALNFTEVEL